MKIFLRVSFGLGLLAAAGVHATYVTVGNPGNAGDTTTYGSVAYEYQINQFEVTAGEYAAFLNAVDPTGANALGLYNSNMDSQSFGCQITWNGGTATYDFSGAPSGAAADWQNRPVNYVSWYDAARYTNWLTSGDTETGVYDTSASGWGSSSAGDYTGFMDHQFAAVIYGTAYFIPTEDEWYKAAYYDPNKGGSDVPGYYDYPTGSDTAPGYVNDSGNLSGGGAFAEGGVDPGGYATYDGDAGTDGVGPDYYRTNVGEWENSASPYGTFDQGGNVFEWNEALIISGSDRGVRGGSFGDGASYLRADDFRGIDDPTAEINSFGFRVASLTSVPEPTSLVLLALAGLGMVARRRRVA